MTFQKKTLLQLMLLPILSLHTTITLAATAPASAQADAGDSKIAHKHAHQHTRAHAKKSLDRSGTTRKGKASYYGHEFYGKKMANGKPMNPRSDIAASKTLPLGTKAKVTNLETGKSAVVKIEDRGPYVDGRIIDVTPMTAEKLDITKQGVAPVEVKPLEVPAKGDDVKADSSRMTPQVPETKQR